MERLPFLTLDITEHFCRDWQGLNTTHLNGITARYCPWRHQHGKPQKLCQVPMAGKCHHPPPQRESRCSEEWEEHPNGGAADGCPQLGRWKEFYQ